MGNIINIVKASGEIEPFSEDKVISSLMRAGASLELAKKIVEQIKPSLYQNIPSFEIYSSVMNILKKEQKRIASRYNLKEAIMQLGPSGYPFEKYAAGVLEAAGFKTETNKIIMGRCVSHEVDIVAQKEQKFMVECKFHTQAGMKTDIKVALYTYARFLDVKGKGFDVSWLITNTKVTQEVKTYALCVGMKVTAWDYPEGESLNELIDKEGLHPVTALTDISEEEKRFLLDNGTIFVKDIKSRE